MNSTTKISLILSFSLAIFLFFISSILLKLDIQTVSIIVLTSAVFTFLLIKYSFIHFIKNRIEPIFKTIYKEDKINDNNNNHSLDEIEKDAKELQKKKNLNISNLEKQINFKKEFLGNISHELKTPLFSVQGYIDTLIDGGVYDENINIAYLRKASKNIERLSAIISDIDLIAKIESNALKLHKTNFKINDLINETIEDLELLADKNDIEIIFNEKKKDIIVNADRLKIKEVLINLISNSLKYGKENGITAIDIFDIEDRVLIRISDNGMGIKQEQLSRIFERFYRIDDNRSRLIGGSGLGLAIVKHFLEAHNQSINVKSDFGKGSTFEFTLQK